MDVRLLGPVEVSADGRTVRLGGPKPRAVLAMLALDPGTTVSTDRLIEGLWGEEPPATAAKTLQVYVSRLRKALTANGDGTDIVTRARGYELRLAPDDVDACRFERLLAHGAPREALALWRGPPLDDVADEPFAAAEIRRLEELRLAAIEQAIDADLAAGRHRELVGELGGLVAEHALHERFHGQLMVALYRSGRQAEALEGYRRARATLVDQIGVEPGRELRELHEAILRQDPSLALEDEATPPPERENGERRAVACPFKGLASFDVDDADVFFGRERLVSEMVARAVAAPVIGVVGPSGSGKSSLLRAGLLASLRGGALPGSERWSIALLRPGERPLEAIERTRRAAPEHARLVLAIDQLEEVFTACDDETERAAFIEALVAYTRDEHRRTLVVVALRADFYGRCAAYPEFARLLSANHVLVGPMRRDELRRAIELPARRAGLRIEPDLVEALIADVEGEPGALPLLSAALLELWLQRDGRALRMSAYEHTGGVRGAVARLAETAYEELDPGQRAVARRILLRLVGETDAEGSAVVRRRISLAELDVERDEQAGEVLSALVHHRLVTIGDGEVEVAHEALLREWPRLRGWLEEDVQGRRLHRHLRAAAQVWDAGARDPGELYRGARLASALDWWSTHDSDLNEIARHFLVESRRASERAQRRLRAVLAGISALLVVAVIAGVVALQQRANARDQATAADAQRLGSRALVEDNLDRALLLARQGVALDDTVHTRGNLLAALLKSPAAIGVLRADSERILAAALSPDERTLAVGNIPGRVSLFDTRTRRRVAMLEPTPNGAAIHELAFSPDGSRLAVAHAIAPGDPYTASPTGIAVTVLDTRSHQTVTRLTLPPGRPITGLRFSPDARIIGVMAITGYPDGASTFTRFDARTGRRILGPLRVNRRGYSPLMITSDGRRMVVVGYDGVTVRDAATLEVLERFPGVGVSAALTASPLHFQTVSAPYALSGDDRTVAIGDVDGSLRLLDLETGNVRTASGRHAAAVSDARFTPDGRSVITTGNDGDVTVWDVRRGAALEPLSGHAGFVFSPMISRDGTTLYTASLDGTVLIWDLAGQRRLGRPLRVGAEGTGGAGTALSSDGRVIAVARRGGAIGVVDADSMKERRTIAVLSAGDVTRLLFVPGARLLVVGGDTGQLALVDTDTGKVVPLRGHRDYIVTPGVSADGRLLVTAGVGGDVRVRSLPDGRALGAPLRFPHGIYDAQLSPDGRRLALVLFAESGVPDTLEVWDVESRRRVVRRRPGDNTNLVRFSPDGRLVAVGNNSGRARVWSTTTWQPVSRSFAGHAGALNGAAISRDGRMLATGGDDGTVRLWDIGSGQAVGAPLPGVPNTPVVPSFTPDSARLLAAYETGDAYLWDIRPESLVRQACRVAGRRLTRAEWSEFLPGRDYDPAC
jgi:WD40 repeat protein/DNA-binding SARP family transcriptional activator